MKANSELAQESYKRVISLALLNVVSLLIVALGVNIYLLDQHAYVEVPNPFLQRLIYFGFFTLLPFFVSLPSLLNSENWGALRKKLTWFAIFVGCVLATWLFLIYFFDRGVAQGYLISQTGSSADGADTVLFLLNFICGIFSVAIGFFGLSIFAKNNSGLLLNLRLNLFILAIFFTPLAFFPKLLFFPIQLIDKLFYGRL